jgi:hypothetical protein
LLEIRGGYAAGKTQLGIAPASGKREIPGVPAAKPESIGEFT